MVETAAAMALQAEAGRAPGAGVGFLVTLIWLALVVVLIAAIWKVFTKAGQPGWAVIIPIYNLIIILKVAQRPVWWILLYLIPLVNLVISIIVAIDIAKNFGKGAGFGIGLWLLPIIFFPVLAWSDAQYQPQAA